MDVEIKPLDEADIALMAHKMRPVDLKEFRIMAPDKSPMESLQHLLERSRKASAGYVDGRLVCVYGVISPTILSVEGHPWLAATDAVNDPKVRRVFLMSGKSELQRVSSGFSRLWNFVLAENKIAVRWLKWMGFEFEADSYDVRGHEFLRFKMEA